MQWQSSASADPNVYCAPEINRHRCCRHSYVALLFLKALMTKLLDWLQVLLEDCSDADVAEQASGVVEAVLQGRNSVVLALGQAGSGKSHTMLGGALHDVDASSSTGWAGAHCYGVT